MLRRKLLQGMVLGSAVLVAGNVTGPAQAADTLKVGFAGAQTGYLAPYDQPSLKGVELAVDEVNAAGGSGGEIMIELIAKVIRSDTAQAAVVAQELIDEGISFLIAPCDADPAIAAGSVAQAAEVPAITSCASTPTIAAAVGPYMFVNYTPDNLQGAALAMHARDEGYNNSYIMLSRDTPYTEKLPEYFAEAFESLGGKNLGVSEYATGQQDFSAEVTKIKGLSPQPDVIMTSAYEPDFPAFIKQLRAAGINTPVLGSDGIDSPTTLSLGEVAEGVVFSNAGFATPGSPLEAMNQAYEAKFGEPNDTTFTATGYDIIKVLEAAVTAAGSTDGPAIRDAMDQLEGVQGATGKITYLDQERVPLRNVALNRVKGGSLEHVADVTPDPSVVPKP